MPRQATSTSFKKGNPGGPGRPKGSKSLTPRVRVLVNSVLEEPETQETTRTTLRGVLTSRKTILPSLELAARLNREIGPGSAEAIPGGVTVVLVSNVDPTKLAAARSRALPA